MIDSDFSVGFKQGQDHGKQIMLEKIEDIKAEIEFQKKGFPPSSDYYKAITRAVNIIDKHISGKEQE